MAGISFDLTVDFNMLYNAKAANLMFYNVNLFYSSAHLIIAQFVLSRIIEELYMITL